MIPPLTVRLPLINYYEKFNTCYEVFKFSIFTIAKVVLVAAVCIGLIASSLIMTKSVAMFGLEISKVAYLAHPVLGIAFFAITASAILCTAGMNIIFAKEMTQRVAVYLFNVTKESH